MKTLVASSFLLATTLALLPAAAIASPGAHGPNGEHLDGPAIVKVDGLARLPDGSVQVPVPAQRRMGVLTRFIPLVDAVGAQVLTGRVVMDPNAGGRVQTVYGGRVEPGPRGLPEAGRAVRRGDVLAYVRYHGDPYAHANQAAALSELRANRGLAEQRVLRLQALEGSVPRKEIEAAQAELASLKAREREVGGSLSAPEALVAPVDGVIASANVLAGQVVEPRDVLFEIVDPRRVLVEAVTADPTLAARITGAQLREVPGMTMRLTGVGRALRDGVLPLTFRAELPRPATDGKVAVLPLAVGQTLNVIAATETRLKGYVLPAQAVVRNAANEPIVWIKSGPERYIPQPVQYQPLDSTTVVVTNGLGEANRVVVQGASLIAQIR
ncbi:efflux RND transporter periplasmic adaptor subunit [Roseateles sp.]|uniref:efflux RND transporter periplasmic adaptor subunit n=1 Tax=Roseateles sp. TaxID=1971397 RepID=UPI003BAC2AB3